MLDGIVELDDTYLGALTHGKKRGRGTEKVKLIVALSKNAAGNPEYVKMSVFKAFGCFGAVILLVVC